ncbi:hypothetical protein NU688_32390 [Variovorax sp. ZS18.2.2]|uniref:hypothetical protein n=1 Tax=Variovorax sp. ZS18.2.2 TaxID=2971255 RepID=UPI0021510280|nr:hypothetical protein [Variovorax sp. ZS18.2.2]MCR6480895.1 hypothetical protein [Variovorax sp. ZS18.2.2]
MALDTNEPTQDDEQLMALCALKARHLYMFNGQHIGLAFYRGWLPDFIGACAEIDRLLGSNKRGFHFRQIKEKYGWARYYWATDNVTPVRLSVVAGSSVLERQLGVDGGDDVNEQISKILQIAEELSRQKCIVCSAPAEIRSFAGWLVCACERHSLDHMPRDRFFAAAHLHEAAE